MELYISVYGILVIIWCLVGLYTTWYLSVGVQRSKATLNALLEQDPDAQFEILIARRRLERERVLMWAEWALLGAGIVAGILLPIPMDDDVIRPVLRLLFPLTLMTAHVLLGVHSYQIHKHHHELINKLTVELLRKQIEVKSKATSSIKDITVTDVDNTRLAIAVVDTAESDHENTTLDNKGE